MTESTQEGELHALLDGLKEDAAGYFQAAENALEDVEIEISARPFGLRSEPPQSWSERDQYWANLPNGIRDAGARLTNRLVSLMGQIARAARNSPLSSEADQRDIVTATKAMRAALLYRRYRSWNVEVLNDEDVVLGVNPAGQSDDEPLDPGEAKRTFAGWAENIGSILDLAEASPGVGSSSNRDVIETVRYRPGTAFIMMWMDPAQPDLSDVADTVKEVFEKFDVRASRADDFEHEGLITERVLSEIKTAEFCFADLSGSRPNVYYEVGFAHALPRRVILFRKAGTGLHFDLAGYNCPEYVNLGDLKNKLTNRLRVLMNKEPNR
jgi:hypothetical protein